MNNVIGLSPRDTGGRMLGATVLTALTLAGCDTVSRATATRQFAVVVADKSGATEVNIASLSDVIQRNPSDAAAYNTRGAAYARAGNYDSAIADFTKAIQLNPSSSSAYGNRRWPTASPDRNDAALQDFTKAINADRTTRPPISAGPTCSGPSATTRRPTATQPGDPLTPESAEAYHARGWCGRRKGSNAPRSAISTPRSTATPSSPRPTPPAARA